MTLSYIQRHRARIDSKIGHAEPLNVKSWTSPSSAALSAAAHAALDMLDITLDQGMLGTSWPQEEVSDPFGSPT